MWFFFLVSWGCPAKKKSRLVGAPTEESYARFISTVLWKLREKPRRALKEISRAIKKDPHSAHLRVSAARLQLHLEQYSQALLSLKEAARLRPDLADTYLVLGGIRMMTGEMKKAKKALLEGLRRAPKWKDIHWALARYHRRVRCRACEARNYRRLLEIDPDDAEALLAFAVLKRRSGKLGDAGRLLRRVLKGAPWYGRAYLELAYVSQEKGEKGKAKRLLYKALEVEDDDLSTAEILWRYLLLRRRRKEALGLLEKLSVHGSPLYRAFMAERFLEQGMREEAQEALKEAVQNHPKAPRVQLLKAKVLTHEGRFKKAEETVLALAGRKKHRGDAAEALADIYLRWGKCRRGEMKLKGLLAHDDLSVLTSLAFLEAECRTEKRHLQTLKEQVAKKGIDEEALYRLAFVLETAGKPRQAVRLATKVLVLSPDNFQAMNFIGFVWGKQGIHLKKAQRLLLRALQLSPWEPMIMDSLAWVLFKRGDLEAAARYLRKALIILPFEPEFLYHLGRVEEKRGELVKARALYRQALRRYPLPWVRDAVEKRLKRVVDKRGRPHGREK